MRFTEIPAPRVLCSITGLSSVHINEDFSFTSSDPNPGKVAQLYQRSGIALPQEFVSLIATQTAPMSNAIQAYGAKNQGSVRRIAESVGDTPVAGGSLLNLADLFPTGVVLVLNDEAKLDIRSGAAEDISTLAGKGVGTLTRIGGTLELVNRALCDLDGRSDIYAEVRLHRPITSADVLEVYSLSEFRKYCAQ